MSVCRCDRSTAILALGLFFSTLAHFLVLSNVAVWSDVASSEWASKTSTRISAIVTVSRSSSEKHLPKEVVVPGAASVQKMRVERHPDRERSKDSFGINEDLDRSNVNDILLSETDRIGPMGQTSAPVSEIAPPSSDAAPPLPGAVTIEFSDGDFFGSSAHLVHRFKQADAHYDLSVEDSKPLSLSGFAQGASLSEGAFVNGELMPARYLGPRGETVRFDWDTQQAVFSISRVVALQGDVKDPLSIMYQLMRLVRSGVTSVVVLDGRDEWRYDLMLLGEEGLDIGGTHYSTWRVRLSRQSDPQSYREFWLGKEVSGMPLKIRELSSDGKVHELLAKRIEVEMP